MPGPGLLRPRRHGGDGHRRERRARPPAAAAARRRDELDVDAAHEAVARVAERLAAAGVEETAARDRRASSTRTCSAPCASSPCSAAVARATFALVAFGGAGGLHANALAAILGCFPVIVPQEPGVLSALGFIVLRHAQRVQPDVHPQRSPTTTPDAVREPPRGARRARRATGSTREGVDGGRPATIRYVARHALPAARATRSRSSSTASSSQRSTLAALERRVRRRRTSASTASARRRRRDREPARRRASAACRRPSSPPRPLRARRTRRARRPARSRSGRRAAYRDVPTYDRAPRSQPGMVVDGPADRRAVRRHDGRPARPRRRRSTRTAEPPDQPEERRMSTSIDVATLDLIENALLNARFEMDEVVRRAAMSPTIREQHDEFPMICNAPRPDGRRPVRLVHPRGRSSRFGGDIRRGRRDPAERPLPVQGLDLPLQRLARDPADLPRRASSSASRRSSAT